MYPPFSCFIHGTLVDKTPRGTPIIFFRYWPGFTDIFSTPNRKFIVTWASPRSGSERQRHARPTTRTTGYGANRQRTYPWQPCVLLKTVLFARTRNKWGLLFINNLTVHLLRSLLRAKLMLAPANILILIIIITTRVYSKVNIWEWTHRKIYLSHFIRRIM